MMASPSSSAKPSIFLHTEKPTVLPKYSNTKEYMPDGSLYQQNGLDSARHEYESVLNEKLVNRIKHINFGYIDHDSESVVVKTKKGIYLRSRQMGVPGVNNQTTLTPEEALFLVESGCLEISGGKDDPPNSNLHPPLSTQQLFSMFVGQGWITLSFYQVYSYLMRAGYSVYRHEVTTCPAYSAFSVRRPRSVNDVDFYVVALESSEEFPAVTSMLEMFRDVGTTVVKIGRVVCGKVDFYTWAKVELPDLNPR